MLSTAIAHLAARTLAACALVASGALVAGAVATHDASPGAVPATVGEAAVRPADGGQRLVVARPAGGMSPATQHDPQTPAAIHPAAHAATHRPEPAATHRATTIASHHASATAALRPNTASCPVGADRRAGQDGMRHG